MDFCYIATHGFAIRMLIQTNLLGKLVEKGYDVGLITTDKNDSQLKEYAKLSGIHLLELPEGAKHQEYLYSRKYFLEDIDENIALKEKHVKSLKKRSRNPWRIVRPYIYYSFYRLNKVFPLIRKLFLSVERNIILKDSATTSFLRGLNVGTLVATYPVTIIEGKLLNSAQKLNIKSVIHLLSWDNITCKGRFPSLADKYIAWGDVMAQELKEYYNVSDRNIYKCGVPHFDIHAELRQAENKEDLITDLGLSNELPYIVFGMSSPYFAPKEIEIVEWLSEKIEKQYKNIQLIVRPHPQNMQGSMADKSWIGRLHKIDKNERTAVQFPRVLKSKIHWNMALSDMANLSKLIKNSILTMNSGSTFSFDAMMHYKKVVITSFDGDNDLSYWDSAKRLIDFPHLKKFESLESVEIVHSFDELEEQIKNISVDTDAIKRDLGVYVEDYEGNATERCVNILCNEI
ncbi:hypothetical protein EMN47_01975 [Prolixibacteraceae bacterium JC049]|nr:hypothetical protein [Prolixibacteraceae bacterium JC049]